MALNWDIKEVENWKELDSSTTESIVWMAMDIGIGRINEKTIDEFIRRTMIVQWMMRYAPRRRFDEETKKRTDIWITPKDIRDRMGLSTNVSKESKAWFKKRVIDEVEKRGGDFRRNLEKEETQ